MGVRFYFGLGAWVVRVLKWVRGGFSLTPIITPIIPIINFALVFIGLLSFVPQSNLRAQSLDSYCLSEASAKPSLVKPHIKQEVYPVKRPEITFETQGQQYQITPSNNHQIDLLDANGKRLGYVWAHQPESGGFYRLILNKNGWLWVDGHVRDYMVHIDLNQVPPKMGELQKMPEIYSSPCSTFSKWMGECLYIDSEYSDILDRVFIRGYPVSLFGSLFGWSKPVYYEIIDGKPKLLPESLQKAILVGLDEIYIEGRSIYKDIPNLKGVLFRGQHGEVFFYDGMKITSVMTGYQLPTDKIHQSWGISTLPFSKRIFIKGITSLGKAFIFEIKSDSSFSPIAVPDKLPVDHPVLFDFPNDHRLFVAMSDRILTEVNEKLQTIITAQTPSRIDGMINYEKEYRPVSGTVILTVRHPTTNASADYLLDHLPTSENCMANLDTDKPIVLNNK